MKRAALIISLTILLAGCLPPQTQPVISDADLIATLVAATQTAASGGDPAPLVTASAEPAQGESPQPQLTASETPTLTLTPTATSTPTQTPTPTLTLTPTLYSEDPVLSLGTPTFKDNFDDGDNFYTYDESQSSFQVEGDRMVLVAKKANSYETWTLAWGDLKNFYLEITGEFGPDCSGKDRFGMIFRAPDTSQGYLISISCDGSYRLSSWESDTEEYTTIKKWTASTHIHSGPGAVNRLGIKAKDSKLTGFINGFQVFELNDSTFNKGRFGLMVAASDTAGFTAYVTQAVYWNLP